MESFSFQYIVPAGLGRNVWSISQVRRNTVNFLNIAEPFVEAPSNGILQPDRCPQRKVAILGLAALKDVLRSRK